MRRIDETRLRRAIGGIDDIELLQIAMERLIRDTGDGIRRIARCQRPEHESSEIQNSGVCVEISIPSVRASCRRASVGATPEIRRDTTGRRPMAPAGRRGTASAHRSPTERRASRTDIPAGSKCLRRRRRPEAPRTAVRQRGAPFEQEGASRNRWHRHGQDHHHDRRHGKPTSGREPCVSGHGWIRNEGASGNCNECMRSSWMKRDRMRTISRCGENSPAAVGSVWGTGARSP